MYSTHKSGAGRRDGHLGTFEFHIWPEYEGCDAGEPEGGLGYEMSGVDGVPHCKWLLKVLVLFLKSHLAECRLRAPSCD